MVYVCGRASPWEWGPHKGAEVKVQNSNGPTARGQSGCSYTILNQRLFSNSIISLGILTFLSGAKKENPCTESKNMVSI
jgi:hypothetical protein